MYDLEIIDGQTNKKIIEVTITNDTLDNYKRFVVVFNDITYISRV